MEKVIRNILIINLQPKQHILNNLGIAKNKKNLNFI